VSGYNLSKEADSDLETIYLFTHERWGERQAETYINGLFLTFDRLAEFHEMGRARPELSSKLRSLAHKSHVIYYQIMGEVIGISRILHGSMDIENAEFFDE
jgi:toxin ParE1/3/4